MSPGLISLQEELEELQAVVDAERDKFSQQRETVQREVTTKVTEVVKNDKVHCIKTSLFNDLISLLLEREHFSYEVSLILMLISVLFHL